MSGEAHSASEVDVIILSWNRVDDTIAAIASAAEQQGVAKSILVVDQGSEPENLCTLEAYLRSVPGAVLKKLGYNSGVAGGRNIAAGMGRAPYIVGLDSDAVFADAHMLARAVAHLNRNANLCAIGFRIQNYFTGKNDETAWDYPQNCSPDQSFPTTRFMGGGHAIRRSTFEAVGAYDARLFFCGEEVDLCYRMLNTGMRIEYVPAITILHKISPAHRVSWAKGRFFYTVRNSLYTLYKLRIPRGRRLIAAGAFLVRGTSNGMPWVAARGIAASLSMCNAWRRSGGSAASEPLNGATWKYIYTCEVGRRASVFSKLRRQLSRLPQQVGS